MEFDISYSYVSTYKKIQIFHKKMKAFTYCCSEMNHNSLQQHKFANMESRCERSMPLSAQMLTNVDVIATSPFVYDSQAEKKMRTTLAELVESSLTFDGNKKKKSCILESMRITYKHIFEQCSMYSWTKKLTLEENFAIKMYTLTLGINELDDVEGGGHLSYELNRILINECGGELKKMSPFFSIMETALLKLPKNNDPVVYRGLNITTITPRMDYAEILSRQLSDIYSDGAYIQWKHFVLCSSTLDRAETVCSDELDEVQIDHCVESCSDKLAKPKIQGRIMFKINTDDANYIAPFSAGDVYYRDYMLSPFTKYIVTSAPKLQTTTTGFVVDIELTDILTKYQ